MLTRSEAYTELHPTSTRLEPTIALLPWGDVWEDFLDTIDVSLETFCNEGPGGWMLGYIEALQILGVRTVLILISTRVDKPLRFRHASTNATISVLPASKSFRIIRRQMTKAHFSLDKFASLVVPYLATPLRLVASELRREKCCAIFCQEYEYPRFDSCILLGKLLHLPVFASFQGGDFDGNRIGRFLRPLTIQACAGLVIGTQTEIDRVRNRYKLQVDKIAKIFNPVDLRMWEATDRHEARAMFELPIDAQVVVWHGRISIYRKGLDILLDAWEKVCSERKERNLRLFLLGTGQDAEKLRQRIAALPAQNVLWVDEYVTDRNFIKHFLSTGDVYAFPSRVEGFAVAPIEAMACGLPVVAAEAPGVPDMLEGNEASGGMVVPRNDVNHFAQALGRILDDKALEVDLSKRARRRVEEYFSLETVGRQLRDFLLKSKLSE